MTSQILRLLVVASVGLGPSVSYAAGNPGGGALEVVDGSGKVVGPYSAFPYDLSVTSAVVVKIDDLWFEFPIKRSGFVVDGGFLYYKSPDCTGQAYVSSGADDSPILNPINSGYGNAFLAAGTIYYGSASLAEPFDASSCQPVLPEGTVGGCQFLCGGVHGAPAQKIDASPFLDKFIPPFTLKVRR
jgi:hypothetical protein